MAVRDTAIANIAPPTIALPTIDLATIAHDLGASPENAIWVINAYQIAMVMRLLPVAVLGEIYGDRRFSIIGRSLFMLATLDN